MTMTPSRCSTSSRPRSARRLSNGIIWNPAPRYGKCASPKSHDRRARVRFHESRRMRRPRPGERFKPRHSWQENHRMKPLHRALWNGCRVAAPARWLLALACACIPVASHSAEALALKKIMQDLGKDMQAATDGISREDYELKIGRASC